MFSYHLIQHADGSESSEQSGQIYTLLACASYHLEGGRHQGLLRGYIPRYLGYRTNVVAIPIFNSLFFPLFEYAKHYFAREGHS